MLKLALALIATVPQTQAPKIAWNGKAFEIEKAGKVHTIPIEAQAFEASTAQDSILFRKDETFVVWDSRGLSVRRDGKTTTTRFESFLLDPKYHSPIELAENRHLLQLGKLKRGCTEAVAAMRYSESTLWILRWNRSTGEPHEDILAVCSIKTGRPRLVGKLKGQLVASGGVTDRLSILNDKLCFIESDGRQWGVVQWDINTSRVTRSGLGERLMQAGKMGPRARSFVEATSHGTTILGRVDLQTMKRRDLAETPDRILLIDKAVPWIALVFDGDQWIQNLESGAKKKLADGTLVKRTPEGVLVWSGDQSPRDAMLLDPDRWNVLATWKASAQNVAKKPEAKPEPKTPPKPASKPSAKKPATKKPS